MSKPDHQFVSMGSTPYTCMQCSIPGCNELASAHNFQKTIELSEHVMRYFPEGYEHPTETRARLEGVLVRQSKIATAFPSSSRSHTKPRTVAILGLYDGGHSRSAFFDRHTSRSPERLPHVTNGHQPPRSRSTTAVLAGLINEYEASDFYQSVPQPADEEDN